VGADVQSNENAFLIGKVPEDLFDRWGKATDQGRKRNDLVAGGKLRMLQEVDHFDRIATVEVLLADLM